MEAQEKPVCQARWLGLIDYDQAWELQNRLAAQIAAGKLPPTFLLLEHPPVYTLGRRGGWEHLLWDPAECARRGITVREVDRGGDITYHGPGQLVGYPLLPLARSGWQADSPRLPQADFVGYLRKLEAVIIGALAQLGLASGQREGYTGVWVPAGVMAKCRACRPDDRPQPAKIASIGVKVDAHGVTRHGFALNVNPNMDHWQGIVACGIDGVRMTSLAELLSPCPDMAQVRQAVLQEFAVQFHVLIESV